MTDLGSNPKETLREDRVLHSLIEQFFPEIVELDRLRAQHVAAERQRLAETYGEPSRAMDALSIFHFRLVLDAPSQARGYPPFADELLSGPTTLSVGDLRDYAGAMLGLVHVSPNVLALSCGATLLDSDEGAVEQILRDCWVGPETPVFVVSLL